MREIKEGQNKIRKIYGIFFKEKKKQVAHTTHILHAKNIKCIFST